MVIILDTFPASSVAKRPGLILSLSDKCRQWVEDCEEAGHTVLVPAICYYEARRELEQRQAVAQMLRLRAYCLSSKRYIPLTTIHLEEAARLWGEARRAGLPTAASQALDGDVILAAQTLSLGISPQEYVVATTNVGHLTKFVSCDEWTNIKL